MKRLLLTASLLAFAPHAHATEPCRIEIVNEFTVRTLKCNVLIDNEPTPVPTVIPTPAPTSPVPPGCTNRGKITTPIGSGWFAVENVKIPADRCFHYEAVLPVAAKRVRMQLARKCNGANIEMTVTAPIAKPSPQTSTSSANFGSLSHPAGTVAPQTFAVDVRSGELGVDCEDGNRFSLQWRWDS
jgi:hypothetical protein